MQKQKKTFVFVLVQPLGGKTTRFTTLALVYTDATVRLFKAVVVGSETLIKTKL